MRKWAEILQPTPPESSSTNPNLLSSKAAQMYDDRPPAGLHALENTESPVPYNINHFKSDERLHQLRYALSPSLNGWIYVDDSNAEPAEAWSRPHGYVQCEVEWKALAAVVSPDSTATKTHRATVTYYICIWRGS